MGCTQSGEADTRLQTVDDSVHVMLQHDKKVQQKKGIAPHGYVPRAQHPLLQPKVPPQVTAQEEEEQEDKDDKPATAASNGTTSTLPVEQ